MVSLVVPASSERMLARAQRLPVPEVVIDLEDSVLPGRKEEALAQALAAMEQGFAAQSVALRVNSPGSRWLDAELRAVAGARVPPQTVVIPKAESATELAAVGEQLDDGLGLHALIETAAGLVAAPQIARATPRMTALILGYADLAVSLGRTNEGTGDLDSWLAIQDTVLVAARSAGLQAIDGPFLGIDNAGGLRRSARRAAHLGFDGKWAIHPSQVQPIKDAFRPTAAAVAEATSVLEAFAEAALLGCGASRLNGTLIDEPVRLAALRTLARAEQAEN